MNCPNCGAAMEPVGNRNHLRCDYCLTVHIPPEGQDGLVALDRDHRLSCPGCTVQLKVGTVEGKAVAYCPRCRGVLAASESFAAIVARKRSKRPAGDATDRPFDPEELRRTTSCPACRGRMDTHPYGGGGTAVIDSCHRCHLVWLDSGELTVLGRFVPRRRGR
jgi:Zn-finger nucleic acid-binding protein